MNDGIEILKQIVEDTEDYVKSGDVELYRGRMVANSIDAKMFIKKHG